MRIAMFTENFYPELSGISDSIMTISKALASRGHELHIFAPRYSKKNYVHLKLDYKEPDLGEGVHFHRLFSFPFPGPTGQARLVIPTGLRTLAVKKIQPDVIHTHMFFGVGWEGLLAAKILGLPFMGTSHTPIGEFVKYSPLHGKFFTALSERAVAWYYNRCDFVSAPSQSVLDEMAQYGFRKPHQVLSNPIQLDSFKPVDTQTKHKLKEKFGLGERSILYTGRLAEEKHIDVILRAFALAKGKHPGLTLAITGRGQAERDLKNLAKSLSVADSVKFLGFLDDTQFAELYQASDIFAIASTAETQSIALMQALSTGIPSVVVNARALPQYVNESNGFVVPIGDFQTMAARFNELIDDEQVYNKLSKGAKVSVASLSIDKIADEWEQLYTMIIKQKP